MKKALISPKESPIYYVSEWDGNNPIVLPIENSCRVAEVCDSEFPIAEPLFWFDCPDDCVQDEWYYNTQENECFKIPLPPT
jgi:hypothetical protein